MMMVVYREAELAARPYSAMGCSLTLPLRYTVITPNQQECRGPVEG